MMLDAYIGELTTTDKFNYEGGDWNGNVPKRNSSFFPFAHDIFKIMMKKMKSNEIEGKQVDWGGYVLKANKEQIISIFEEMMEDRKDFVESMKRLTPDGDKKDLYGIERMREELHALEEGKIYALTCVES